MSVGRPLGTVVVVAKTLLGDYLRSRRALVTPGDVGLPTTGARRVPGLRREEVALLAGLSADYYVRLEQGRERRPSVAVLDSLAGVLALDGDGRLYLFGLAGLTPRPRSSSAPERIDAQLLSLMEAWSGQPTIVLGRAYDVLATNRLGEALFGFDRSGGHANLLDKVFLDPQATTFYAQWHRAAVNTVAGFRLLHGQRPEDPRVQDVVSRLLRRSPEFARLWRRHDARGKGAETKRFHHPEVGHLELHMQTFDVRSAPGQQLVVYHAETGSPTERNLALLGSLAATAYSEASTRPSP